MEDPAVEWDLRCGYAQDVCRVERPPLREITPGHFASCHFSEVLELAAAG